MCKVEIDGDRLTLQPTFGTLFGHFFIFGLGIAAVWYGVREFARSGATNEFWVFTPTGLFVIVAATLWYLSSRRPIVLDRKADRAGSHPEPLSSAVKVAVCAIDGADDSTLYVVEIIFPKGRFRLNRSGWNLPTFPTDAEPLAKQVAEFLGVPAEPYFQQPIPVIRLLGGSRKRSEPSPSRSDRAERSGGGTDGRRP